MNHFIKISLILFCSFVEASFAQSNLAVNNFKQNWKAELAASLKNGSAIVVDPSGNIIFEHRAEQKFIPASTIKIATVAAALQSLGPDYRFKTEFYLLPGNILGVKGYGDPSLVSEQIAVIARVLSTKINTRVSGLLLDDSYFDQNIIIDGASNTNNPYDAIPGALVANYNTINIVKLKNGQVVSAENQTPITSIAKRLAKSLKVGKQRINIGKDKKNSLKYFAELLIEFLKKQNIESLNRISFGKINSSNLSNNLIYTHFSEKNVSDISKDLLKYSTNFLANQLFIHIGINRFLAPGNIQKSRDALNSFLSNRLNWSSLVYEGSGLSRKTKVSAKEMIKLLGHFNSYKDLLPEVSSRILAKTGTLNSVNTLAGYIKDRYRFVILINSKVSRDHRLKLAKQIRDNLN